MRLFSFLLWCVATTAAVADDPLPVYQAPHATAPLVIDGLLDEPDWADAPAVTLAFPWEEQTGAKQRTTVKLLWDEKQLYVGYTCDDADLTASYLNHDDPVYNDDCVELFVNPNPARSNMYYGLEMNCRGVLYDYFYAFPVVLLKQVDLLGAQLKTKCRGTLNLREDRDSGWTLELAVPFAAFAELQSKAPVAGASWRLNLNRWDGLDDRRLSQWSPSGKERPNPHAPERFGVLTFIDQRKR